MQYTLNLVVVSLFFSVSAVPYRLEYDIEETFEDYIDYEKLAAEINWEWKAIFPGTKWCGEGDIAKDHDDLGFFKETDKCCRSHDLCDDIILAGESNHGLTNDGRFTRLHCKCDKEFFQCLKAIKMPIPTIIGTTYFNLLGGQCFEEKYPIIKCLKWDSIVGQRKRCVEYELDDTKQKVWQWFDVPRYISLGKKTYKLYPYV